MHRQCQEEPFGHSEKITQIFHRTSEKQFSRLHNCQKGRDPFGNGGAADAESDACRYAATGR